nr:hypothetical protein [Azospirillum baldaniorum]
MHALGGDLIHHGVDGRIATKGEPIDAGPHQEMRAHLLSQAEQLVDVALAIANVDAASRIAEQFRGPAQVLQPADTLLLLDGNPRRVDLSLEGGGSLELGPGPELDRAEPQGKTLGRGRQTGVHQQPTHGVHAEPALLALTTVDPDGLANLLRMLTLEGKLRGVLNDQDGAGGCGDPRACRIEVAGENIRVAHPLVGEEPVGRLGVGPVLAGQRNAVAHPPGHLIEQRAQASPQPLVGKVAAGEFILDPGVGSRGHQHLPSIVRCQQATDGRHSRWRPPSSAVLPDVGN